MCMATAFLFIIISREYLFQATKYSITILKLCVQKIKITFIQNIVAPNQIKDFECLQRNNPLRVSGFWSKIIARI